MIHHYFDLQIRVDFDHELDMHEESAVCDALYEVVLDSNFREHLRQYMIDSDNPPVFGFSIGDIALAWRQDEEGREV